MRKPSWWKWSCFGSIEIFIKTVFKNLAIRYNKSTGYVLPTQMHIRRTMYMLRRALCCIICLLLAAAPAAMAENTFTMALSLIHI